MIAESSREFFFNYFATFAFYVEGFIKIVLLHSRVPQICQSVLWLVLVFANFNSSGL